MSKAVQTFLRQLRAPRGLAAWGARLPDRTMATHCYSDWFKPAQVEQVMSRLLQAAEGLHTHGIHSPRLCWVFDRARIFLVLRPDAACLALFVENRPEIEMPALERVLANFSALKV